MLSLVSVLRFARPRASSPSLFIATYLDLFVLMSFNWVHLSPNVATYVSLLYYSITCHPSLLYCFCFISFYCYLYLLEYYSFEAFLFPPSSIRCVDMAEIYEYSFEGTFVGASCNEAVTLHGTDTNR